MRLVVLAAVALAFGASAFAEPSAEPWRSPDGVIEVAIPSGWRVFDVQARAPYTALFVGTPNVFEGNERAEACQVLRSEARVAAPESQSVLNGDVSRYARRYIEEHSTATSSFEHLRGVLVFLADGVAEDRHQREVVRAFQITVGDASVFYILMCAQTLETDATPTRIDAFMNSFRLNTEAAQ